MKATGIVRRIDDLGRVVIPKEIRRNLRIKEGDPLELFIEDGGVLFKKYNYATPAIDVVKDLELYINDADGLKDKPSLLQKVQEPKALLKAEQDD